MTTVVSVETGDAIKAEGNVGTTSFSFTISQLGDSATSNTVDWSITGRGSNPASSSDFLGGVYPTGTVTFGAGETTKTVVVQIIGDTTVEPDEGFRVTLSNPSPGVALGTSTASGTILNDDVSVASIAATDAVKPEGDSDVTPFTFTVSLSQASVSSQSISWSVSGAGSFGADVQDLDSTALNGGTVTFGPGETSKTITVFVKGDTTVEPDEGFAVTLANPSSDLTIGTGSATGTILNDDRSVVSIGALSTAKPEGNSGTTPSTFTVSLDQAAAATQTVDWSVAGSGAHPANGTDFVAGALPSGTVTFAPGETSKTIIIGVSSDTTVELDEGFTVSLANPSSGLTIGAASATGTIQNDDSSAVSIAGADAVKSEGNSGTTPFTFTVSLSQASVSSQGISWSVAGAGSFGADVQDFDSTALNGGTVTFNAGETSKTITVLVKGDTTVEPDEGFAVTLANPSSGLTIGTGSATGTIQNDDKSVVSIGALSAAKVEGNSGTTSFTFTVTLDQPAVTSQSVNWGVAGSGANPANAVDFGGALPGGTVTFAPGETSHTITVAVSGDTTVEPDEGFTVTLGNPSSGLTIGSGSAAGTIQNGDAAAALVAHNDAYVVAQDHVLTTPAAVSVLFNDDNATAATVTTEPTHGSLQLQGDGSFSYTPDAGFSGIDGFAYHASNDSNSGDGEVLLFVVPTQGTTLNLLALNAGEQIAATYAAFFGRAADAAGFQFWVGQFNAGLPTQGASALFANIASSFGVSGEAKALYPFLANPQGASSSQISSFLDTVYNNLFNRSSDPAGLAYWTGQIQNTLAAGKFVGSVLVDIISGTQVGPDVQTLMGKVAVTLDFVVQQVQHQIQWNGVTDNPAATALLHAVTSDPQSVLVGIKQADLLIAAHG